MNLRHKLVFFLPKDITSNASISEMSLQDLFLNLFFVKEIKELILLSQHATFGIGHMYLTHFVTAL